MYLAAVVIILAACQLLVAVAELNLVQLNLMFRHGARTPFERTYPTDPYKDFDYAPYGRGQLTKGGKRDAFNVGTQIRRRYNDFLGRHYNNTEFHLYSDGSVRVQETGLIAMAALWPPTATEMIQPNLRWQPVSYQFREYYPADDGSENYKYMYILKDPEFVKKRLDPYMDQITYIKEKSEITDVNDITLIWSTIAPQIRLEMPLPEWFDKVYPEPISELNYNLYAAEVFSKELRQKGGCKDLDEWVSNMQGYLQNKTMAKTHFYAAHDNNIIVMLECLNVGQRLSPDFASNLAVELYEEYGEYLIRIAYQRTLSKDPIFLTIPGCSVLCPWKKFYESLQKRNH